MEERKGIVEIVGEVIYVLMINKSRHVGFVMVRPSVNTIGKDILVRNVKGQAYASIVE
jgi:hypothetical protein